MMSGMFAIEGKMAWRKTLQWGDVVSENPTIHRLIKAWSFLRALVLI
jgi:hypothetical protein